MFLVSKVTTRFGQVRFDIDRLFWLIVMTFSLFGSNAVSVQGASLVISEFMAANTADLRDVDNEYSDWIEIYNPGNSAISLLGWSLSDDADSLSKWQFPAVTIPARGFLTVFASGKNRTNATAQLHTNFKLDQAGESVVLSTPTGEVASGIYGYPRQLANHSYGLSMAVETQILLPFNAIARTLIPDAATQAPTWMQPGFNDSSWSNTAMGLGYDRIPPGTVDPAEPPVTAEDITVPSDIIVGTSANSPGGEEVFRAIDNSTSTKYLNFDKLQAGFTVSPANANAVVGGLILTSANDAPERDPTSFILSGSQDGRIFEEIARGSIPAFSNRFTPVKVTFPNGKAYQHYRLTFPTVANAAAAVAMQIAEVEFLGQSGEIAPSFQGYIKSNLENWLYNKRSSVQARFSFFIPAGSTVDNLLLRLRYDDGYAAWLNGTLVASANAPANFGWNGLANTNRFRQDAVNEVRLNLTSRINLLQKSTNLLAIQVWNDKINSADLLLDTQLENNRFIAGSEGYFSDPTPGAENSTALEGIVADVIPSKEHGFFESAFDLELASGTPDVTIRYTLDGSEPTASTGQVFNQPIRIDRTRVLRAAAFRTNWIASRVTTATYIFLDDVIRQTRASTLAAGFPANWNNQAADYGLDPRVIGPSDSFGGKYSRTIKSDLQSLPTISLVMKTEDMFGPQGIYANSVAHGEIWERPLSIELITPGENTGFQADAGIRIQGGAFRRFDLTLKKSFRIVFRQEYGEGTLNFPLFGRNAAGEFNNFVLRANGNDAWPYGGANALYMRDAFAMETVRQMGSVSSHTRFVHLYINGFYWGMYNMVERPDAAFSASYHGGNRDTWDALNQDSAPDGNYDAWNRLLAGLTQDVTQNEVYQRLQGNNPDGTRNPAYENLIDVDSLIDYMIMNFYVGNADWPHRNWWAGRDRNNGDGFKFYPWDTETALGFTGVTHNSTGVSDAVARPYAVLRANADFRIRFADHVYRHFSTGGVFYVNPASPIFSITKPENNPAAARFYAISESVRAGVVGESARWGDQLRATSSTRDEHWLPTRDGLLANYFPQRSAIVLQQFRDAGLYPRTEPPVMNQRGGQVPKGFQLIMTAPQGSIFYSTNGVDPRAPVTVNEISRTALVRTNAAKKVLVPSTANRGNVLGTQWHGNQEPFDETGWVGGTGGVGYDTAQDYLPLIQINVRTAMSGLNGSVFIRIPFDFDGANKNRLNFMTLRMKYDDGFVAFLNGVKIGSANAPTTLQWNSDASGSNPDNAAVIFQDFNADDGLPALKTGRNILAIQGLNAGVGSSDFLVVPELIVGEIKTSTNTTGALRYTGPITLGDQTTVKARVLNGTEWSALVEGRFVVGTPALVISEINYHPSRLTEEEKMAGFTDSDEFEFIEFWNNGTAAYELRDLKFARGIQFDFADSTQGQLNPGEYLLLVKNQAAFEKRYGTNVVVAGVYGGSLDNNGERVQLMEGTNSIVDLKYETDGSWPASADGDGPSLEVVNPENDLFAADNWRASAVTGGSPGRKNPLPGVIIQSPILNDGVLRFDFQGRTGASYILYGANSVDGTWTEVKRVERLTEDRLVEVAIIEEGNPNTRFFRVMTE